MWSALKVAGVHHVENILVARDDGKYAKYIRTDADIAHGVLMGIAIVLFFPIGGLIARLSKSRHMLWIHVGCQVTGLIVFLGGFGTGVWTCIVHDEIYTDPHTTYGTVIVGFFLIQPIFGWLHHRGYVNKGGPTLWTRAHVWFGRIIMILAIVNGGLGIQYADNAVSGEKGFGVVTGIFGLAYIGAVVWAYVRNGKQVEQRKSEESMVAVAYGEKGALEEVKEVQP